MASRSKSLKRAILAFIVIVGLVLAVGAMAIYANVFPEWTGFGQSSTSLQNAQRQKTLWDWMSLLLVPAALAFLAYWLKVLENQREQRQSRDAARIADQRSQDAALQSYLDHMTKLLLEQDLRSSKPTDETRIIARTRTLTALNGLDGKRKAVVISFLHEAGLIFKAPRGPVIALARADLSNADLRSAYLRFVDLEGAIMQNVDLSFADLRGADLTKADLSGANLERATMKWSNLHRANLTNANLSRANLRLAKLTRTNLTHAILEETCLHDASMREADLTDALLVDADFRGADIVGWKVTREQLSLAKNVGTPPSRIELPQPQNDGTSQSKDQGNG